MVMRIVFCFVLLFACFLLPVFPDQYLSIGTAGFMELAEPYPLSPDLRLLFGFDRLEALSDEWSLFYSGSAFSYFRPASRMLRYLYAGVFMASFREGDFFIKADIASRGEQYFANAIDLPDVFQNSLAFKIAYDFNDITLFFNPMISYEAEDYLEDNVLLAGEIGASFLAAERLIATGKARGSVIVIPLHHAAWTGIFQIDLSWYPDLPLIAAFSLGARLNDADYTELLNSVYVKPLDYLQAFFVSDLAIFFSDTVSLSILLPVKMSLKEMNGVRDGVFIGEREWTIVASPELELSFAFTGNHSLVCLLKGEPIFSNSDYYEAGFIEVSVYYQLDF